MTDEKFQSLVKEFKAENPEAQAALSAPTGYPRRMSEDEGIIVLKSICPACLHTPLRAGPCGGMSQNVLCPKCHHEFCAAPVPTWCEWMGTASKDRLAWSYGIVDNAELTDGSAKTKDV